MRKTEYQDLFERGRTPDFWGDEDAAVIGVGIRSSRSHPRTPLLKPPPSPAGRLGRLREVKREKRPVRKQGQRAHLASDDTDVDAQACLPGGV